MYINLCIIKKRKIYDILLRYIIYKVNFNCSVKLEKKVIFKINEIWYT